MATEATSEIQDRTVTNLQSRFPGAVQPAHAPQEGIVVSRNRLVEVVTFLRDNEQFNYLSSVTGVDYPEATNGLQPRFETVYHLYRDTGGPLVIHVHADRVYPTVPSLAPIFPSAEYQEREVWDLMGIRFKGNGALRRLFLPFTLSSSSQYIHQKGLLRVRNNVTSPTRSVFTLWLDDFSFLAMPHLLSAETRGFRRNSI